MAYANGRLPASLLATVESKTRLLKADAPVYYAFRMYAADRSRWLGIANQGKGGGGGYRTYAMQGEMQRGSLGNLALAEKYDLNPHSSVPLAGPGGSSHGKPDRARLDLIGGGNGAKRYSDQAWILAHITAFGMIREFGAADPNHVAVIGSNAALWRHSVGTTGMSLTGSPGGAGTAAWKRLQLLARLGGYRGAIDGDLGDGSYQGLRAELTTAVGHIGSGRDDLYGALQKWAGVAAKSIVITADPKKVPAKNWRAIGTKLNRL